MIRIERPKISPAELSGTKSNPSVGERERAEVIKFYALKSNLNKAFKFKAYKGKTVIEHLTSLFSGKCAYCESKYWGTQPVDVEHYRPKGGVMVPQLRSAKQSGRSRSTKASNTDQYKLRKPGYYWLAASWENLLPACIDCTRERNQKIPDQKEPGKFRIVKV